MRIAMISTPFVAVPPRDYGGTELVVHELVEGLASRGHQVTLFATGDSRTSARLRFLYPQAQWPPHPMTDVNHTSWALDEVRRGDFDVIHTHSAVSLAFARLLPEIPVVYTLHHDRDESLSALYRHFAQPYYVAISASQARHEVSLPRLAIIHHGLDHAKFQWVPQASDYVCFIGRLARVKGAHTAIDVAARAGVPIHVAGDAHPVDRDYIEAEVLPRLATDHVHALGTVSMDRKVPLLRNARALLMPIDWDEPFGLVMIEAMLSGCPVVAFARGSVPEIVEHGVTGFIARDAAEMADIVRGGGPLDSFDRERCRIRAVQRFNRQRMTEEYERVYQRAMAERLGGRSPRRAA